MPEGKGGLNSKYEIWLLSDIYSDFIGYRRVFTLFRAYLDIHPVPENKPGIYPPIEAFLGI
jgi:hypothetical protein